MVKKIIYAPAAILFQVAIIIMDHMKNKTMERESAKIREEIKSRNPDWAGGNIRP